jgi:oligo-1,6-glucosidase
VWNGNQYGDSFPFVSNGPKIHDYLKEMNEKVLSQYDIITVGEMPGVTTEQAKLYTGEERNELNMVFHFEHVDIGNGKFGKWTPNNWKLSDLKKIFNKWQKELENSGWNSLYWSNHDQPRAVSRWVKTNDNNRETASKMLGTCLHMMKGTPYIYQGEEIGMTNVAFDSIDKYRDVETLNAYKELVDHQKLAHEEMMRGIYQRSRDNARTPMQWNDSEHSGFTKGVPWMDVNPNYQKINVENALKDPNSIFYYYQKLIGLRKKHPIIVHGRFESMMDEDEQIFAYKRILENEVLLVICNFMDCPKNFEMPDELKNKKCEVIITNAERSNEILDSFELKPFEATVFNIK